MSSIVFHTRSGPDSKVHLDVPVAAPNSEFEVEVVVRPKPGAPMLPTGYFDLIGSIDDETFTRPPQGQLLPAVELE